MVRGWRVTSWPGCLQTTTGVQQDQREAITGRCVQGNERKTQNNHDYDMDYYSLFSMLLLLCTDCEHFMKAYYGRRHYGCLYKAL